MAVKRGIDVSLSAGLGLIALPLMVLIAVAIRLDSPGPALFRASRIGRHGTHFSMLKFRTMVADAETRFHEIAHLNVANGMVKIPDDPRVTRIGKWLRRFSLDELPQVYNVLVGHMSIVGPRPHDVLDMALNNITLDPRLSVRPGLTGLWQVSARSDPSLATRIQRDMQYLTQWSLLLDARILAMTVPAVLRGNGGRVDEGRSIPSNGHLTDHAFFANDGHEMHAESRTGLFEPGPKSPTQNGRIPEAIDRHLEVSPIAAGEEGI